MVIISGEGGGWKGVALVMCFSWGATIFMTPNLVAAIQE